MIKTLDVPLFFKGFLEEIDFSELIGTENINYHFGDDAELDRYLELFKTGSNEAIAQQIMESGSFELALSNGDITKPYPLVWLKKVGDGKPSIKHLDNRGCNQEVSGIQLLVICDTKCEWLNTERWTVNMAKLRCIADEITSSFRGFNGAMIKNRFATIKEYANFSKKADCETKWDAVSVEMDLILNSKCIAKKEYKFCKTN